MLLCGECSYGGIFWLSTLSNLLINNAHLVIIAVGLTFVIISGGIDLSVVAIIALSSVSGVMLANAGWNAGLVKIGRAAGRERGRKTGGGWGPSAEVTGEHHESRGEQ